MTLAYAYEKAKSAVHLMVAGSEPVQGRVARAFTHELSMIQADREELTEEERELLEEIRAELTTATPVADEGTVATTTTQMSDDDVARVARQMIAFFELVAVHLRDHRA